MKKLSPANCKDQDTVSKLNEQGIGINDKAIRIEPNLVIIDIANTTLRIDMRTFRIFAEWYLEEQEIK